MASKELFSSVLDQRKAPSQARARMTVDAIVEAAARILETDGKKRYSTNAVAQIAGVSIGSLYQYFPNKSAITRALIDREAELLLADIGAIASDQDPIAMLDELIAIAIRHQLRRPVLAQTMDIEEDRLPPSEAFLAAGHKAISMFRDCLAAIGMAPGDDVSIVTRHVVSILRAIKESAGSEDIANQDGLIARARLAVHGYLGLSVGNGKPAVSNIYEINKSHSRDSTETHIPSHAPVSSLQSAPKGRPYSRDLRARVIAAVKSGLSRRHAAALFGVSYSAAICWMKRLEETGSASPKRKGGRKPKKISGAHHSWLAARCRDRTFTLHGLVAELSQQGLEVDYRSVWEFVHASGLRYKNGRWRSEADATAS